MNDMHEFPKCLNCGKILNDRNVKNFCYGYTKYCGRICQITSNEFKQQRILTWRQNYNDDSITSPSQVPIVREKQKQTCKTLFGVEHPMQNSSILKKSQDTKQQKYGNKNYVNPQKAKSTKLEKYGNENYANIRQAKETCIKKYGVDNYAKTTMWLESYTQTSLDKYGTKSPNSSDIVKQHRIAGVKRKYGEQYSNVSQIPEIHNKIAAKQIESTRKCIETKRKNGTFNTSKQEEDAYHMLHLLHPHLIRQHSSKEYPFACDFYDPTSSIWYECNFSWTHGGHWFDESNEDDLKTLQRWKEKHSRYYDNAIETWTVRDVKKRKLAKKNSLNYIVFWKVEEARKYVLEQLQKCEASVNKNVQTNKETTNGNIDRI